MVDLSPKPHTQQEIRVLKKFWSRINKEKFLNNRSSNYYDKLNNRFTIPTLIATGLSSFISLMSTSDIFNQDEKQYCSIFVGFLVGIATVINSISASYGFNNKKELFSVSADSYDKLLTKIEFEILNPNEIFNDFCDTMESSILEIKSNCKFIPPLFIQNEWTKNRQNEIDDSLINSSESSVEDITTVV